MSEEYQIVSAKEPAWDVIGPAISDYNQQQAGDDNAQRICFVLRAPDETVVGGVIGAVFWDWFHIDLMWVREDLRGRGYGSRLLELAEQQARERGARQAYLDTYSFQAPDFYKKHGYHVFGELPEFPVGHQLYYLTKQL